MHKSLFIKEVNFFFEIIFMENEIAHEANLRFPTRVANAAEKCSSEIQVHPSHSGSVIDLYYFLIFWLRQYCLQYDLQDIVLQLDQLYNHFQ